MRKILGFIICSIIIFSCVNVVKASQVDQSLETSIHEEHEHGPRSPYRSRFYQIPGSFIDLVGLEAYWSWHDSTITYYNYADESIAVSFIREFDISREDFERANEEAYRHFASIPSLLAEVYPVNIIFTFNNSLISYYFLHKNTPQTRYFGSGMEHGRSRRSLFYNMPAVFGELVGRENFIIWKYHRSEYEQANENIAVAFIRYFDISREDFERVNNEAQRMLTMGGFTDEEAWLRSLYRRYFREGGHGSLTREQVAFMDIYPVDLIFSFDEEAINYFFLDESLPIWGNNPYLDFGWSYIGLDPQEMWESHGLDIEDKVSDDIRIRINGEFIYIPYYEQQPLLVNWRTIVPLRVVMEALGFYVEWEETNRIITLTSNNQFVQMQVYNNIMVVNNSNRNLDVPPQITNERTMVPVRAIAEVTGFTVEWDENNRIVDITY